MLINQEFLVKSKEKTMVQNRQWIGILLLFFILLTDIAFGQSSTNYKIQKVVLDQAGRASQSINYKLMDAVGQPSPVGTGMSTNFVWSSGFLTDFGLSTDIEEEGVVDQPKEFRLLQNYPNPFNPVTTIEYHLPVQSDVDLIIYDVRGQLVSKITDLPASAGIHKIQWYGTDNLGQSVTSGVYFYRIQIQSQNRGMTSFIQVKKMIFIK